MDEMTVGEQGVSTEDSVSTRYMDSLITKLEEELVRRMLHSIHDRQAAFKMRDPNPSLVVLMHPKDARLIRASENWRHAFSEHEFKLLGMPVFQTDSAPINDPRVAKLNV